MGGVNQEDGLELATEGHEGPGHLDPKVSWDLISTGTSSLLKKCRQMAIQACFDFDIYAA